MKKILLIFILTLVVAILVVINNNIGLKNIPMILNVMQGSGIDSPETETIGARLQVPEGFSIGVYARDLPNARFITLTSNGDLLVTRPHKGDIVMIRSGEKGARAGERLTLMEGLNKPSGIAVHDGWLYVGEQDSVGRIAFDEAGGETLGSYQKIITGLTSGGNHPYKQIKIGPDNKLYLSQGSTCNVCVEEDPRRATMSRFALDGTGEELVATGLRNTMGFDWTPWNGDLYGTDNGRDMLGDDYPPCELNKIEAGQFYGWPYFNGANDTDPDFPEAPPAVAVNPVPPVHEFRAHNAPLGMTFVANKEWPARFQKSALVALHGSWNRSVLDGYRVVSLHWQGDKVVREDFFSGFEKQGDVIGRPVDVAQGPDGAVYISDDYAGVIYRIAYGEPEQAITATDLSKSEPFVLSQPDWLTDANRPALIAQGKALYEQYNCEGCHVSSGAIGRMNLSTLDQRLQYHEVIESLTNPRAPMPAYPLSDYDKQALATFLINRAQASQ